MITSYIGKMGSGKTITMVRQAWYYYMKGATVYSNIKLKFPYTPLTFELLKSYADEDKSFRNAVFLIDEAYIFFDSRNSMSKGNRTIANFVLQTRKKDVRLLLCTQNFLQIDVRVRNMTDYVVLCKKVVFKGQTYINLEYQYSDDYGATQKSLYRYHANPFFELYDTYEVVRQI